MKHKIDPTVDCVFKTILGTEKNKNLLIHFLNAVMNPVENNRIISVRILNPYNEREFLSDKLSILDIKAKDTAGCIYRIEIQIIVYGAFDKRISYTWSDIYSSQLQKGEDYSTLSPVVSIWVLCEDLFNDSKNYHHYFRLYDPDNKLYLNHDCSIHTLELEKFGAAYINNELDRWLLFFKEGKELDDSNLPEYMNTEEMREAMNILKGFSEKEKAYHLYQSRLNFVREQKTIQLELESTRQEAEKERQEKEKALHLIEKERQEKEKALHLIEKERQEKEKLLQKIKELQRDK